MCFTQQCPYELINNSEINSPFFTEITLVDIDDNNNNDDIILSHSNYTMYDIYDNDVEIKYSFEQLLY